MSTKPSKIPSPNSSAHHKPSGTAGLSPANRKQRGTAKARRCKSSDIPGSFGDLCEISEGLAVVWRRKGCTEREMWAFAEDDSTILCDVVPALHALGFGEDDVLRHVPHDGPLANLLLNFSRLMTTRFSYRKGDFNDGTGILALPPLVAIAFLHRGISRRIAALRNKAARPAHYEAEKARRREMAAERRRVRRRSTLNPCPGRDSLREAWRHVRDSKESLIHFGSMMQDLECYVDNSLRMDESGRIVGRNAGIKGWLWDNLPELAEHYSLVMRYKAAAKKLRQVVGLADPTPVEAVLAGETQGGKREGPACNHGAENFNGEGRNDGGKEDGAGNGGIREGKGEAISRRWMACRTWRQG